MLKDPDGEDANSKQVSQLVQDAIQLHASFLEHVQAHHNNDKRYDADSSCTLMTKLHWIRAIDRAGVRLCAEDVVQNLEPNIGKLLVFFFQTPIRIHF